MTLELINDVSFLLESQVMQVADATTPMRQLYFVVQLMLMSPHDVEEAKAVYREQRCALLVVAENAEMLRGLEAIEELVEAKRYYDALRKIRTLFDVEAIDPERHRTAKSGCNRLKSQAPEIGRTT